MALKQMATMMNDSNLYATPSTTWYTCINHNRHPGAPLIYLAIAIAKWVAEKVHFPFFWNTQFFWLLFSLSAFDCFRSYSVRMDGCRWVNGEAKEIVSTMANEKKNTHTHLIWHGYCTFSVSFFLIFHINLTAFVRDHTILWNISLIANSVAVKHENGGYLSTKKVCSLEIQMNVDNINAKKDEAMQKKFKCMKVWLELMIRCEYVVVCLKSENWTVNMSMNIEHRILFIIGSTLKSRPVQCAC